MMNKTRQNVVLKSFKLHLWDDRRDEIKICASKICSAAMKWLKESLELE